MALLTERERGRRQPLSEAEQDAALLANHDRLFGEKYQKRHEHYFKRNMQGLLAIVGIVGAAFFLKETLIIASAVAVEEIIRRKIVKRRRANASVKK